MFSTLRKGATVYILDRSADPTVNVGYIENVSTPHPMYPTYMQTVVDITMRIGNEKKEFSVPSTLTIHSYGDYTISESKEAMIQEVDALLQDSKNVINSVDKHKKSIESYESILKELNPVYAKESERDSRIDNLAEQVDSMQDTLKRLESFLLRTTQNGNN